MSTPRTALIVVDVQNDFCEGGSLAVTGGLTVASRIAEHLERHHDDYTLVLASRDWHNADCDNGGHFAAPGADPNYTTTWPVHCVAGTTGSEFAPPVAAALTAHADAIVDKGMGEAAYSAFEGTSTGGASVRELLEAHDIESIDVVGIATDYCVRATVLDALATGRPVRVIESLTAAVAEESQQLARAEMTAAGATWAHDTSTASPQ